MVGQATLDFCVAIVAGLEGGPSNLPLNWQEFAERAGLKNVTVAKVRYGQIKKEICNSSPNTSPTKKHQQSPRKKQTPKKASPLSSMPSPPSDVTAPPPMERTPRKAAAASKRKWEEIIKQEESLTEVDDFDDEEDEGGSSPSRSRGHSPVKKERLDEDGVVPGVETPVAAGDEAVFDSGVFSAAS